METAIIVNLIVIVMTDEKKEEEEESLIAFSLTSKTKNVTYVR